MILLMLLSLVGVSLCNSEYKIESLTVEGNHVSTRGEVSILTCHVAPNNTIVWWEKDNKNVTADKRISLKHNVLGNIAVLNLTIRDTRASDIGTFKCRAVLPENRDIQDSKEFALNVTLKGKVVELQSMRANIGADAALSCAFQGYPLANVAWRIGKSGLSELLPQNIETRKINDSFISTKLQFHQVRHYENGTYLCTAEGPDGPFNATAHLYVLNKPNVTIDIVKAVGAGTLYVNWTASDGNEPIKQFFLQTRKNGTNEWLHYPELVGGGNTSFLIQKLEKETAYQVSLSAKNAVGQSEPSVYETWVQTLSHDPEFVPEVTVKGTTSHSLSIGWSQPRPDVRDYIHYYQIILQNNDTRKETIHSAASMNVYMFTELKAMTSYQIKIAACSEYTKQCGPWSRKVNGTTLEGFPEPPENITVSCRFDNISQSSFVLVSWQPPRRPFGVIMHYKVSQFAICLETITVVTLSFIGCICILCTTWVLYIYTPADLMQLRQVYFN